MSDKLLVTNNILFENIQEMTMQSTKFESLISPPWPLTEAPSAENVSFQQQHQHETLSNFERNEKSEESLDHIAMLGYN
jgi:hypothetical protein